MRSVKAERKPRENPRIRTTRKPARLSRDKAPSQGFNRREKSSDSILSGLSRRLGRFFRRPILLMTLGLVIFAAIAALFASGSIGRAIHGVSNAADTVSADAGFSIRAIHITGQRLTPVATIAAALDLHENQSIFSADLAAARARLLALDWVASADVVRRYPDSITVTIVEKRPFALWQAPPDASGVSRLLVVERNGGIITGRDIEGVAPLPKLCGAGAPAAAAVLVDAVQAHRAVSAHLSAY